MKYNKINMMLPTYKRVRNGKLPRFIASIVSMASNHKNVCITFLINRDDNDTIKYLEELEIPVKWFILFTDLNNPHLGKMYNDIYERTPFKKGGTLVSMVGDDMEFKTSGYDIAILNAVNKYNGIVLIYCNDKFQGKKMCTQFFTTRKYVELTRYPFMCELFAAYYIDTVWMRVATKTKTAVYLDNVLLKHHHASFNKRDQDITFQRLQRVKQPFSKGYKLVDKYANEIIKNLKGVL